MYKSTRLCKRSDPRDIQPTMTMLDDDKILNISIDLGTMVGMGEDES